jgi:hypothetical protein
MAFCANCGSQLEEEAQSCRNCGTAVAPASPQAPAPVAATASRSRTPIFIAVAVVVVALLAGGGWFLKNYLDDQALTRRARAQAEVAADFIQGSFISYDSKMIEQAISRDYSNRAGDLLDASPPEGLKVSRAWEDGVLVLAVEESGNNYAVSIQSDGDKESPKVTIDVAGDGQGRGESMYAVLELENGRWIVVDFNGSTMGEMLGDSSSSDGSSGSSQEQACWSNQRTIEGAVQQYLAADTNNSVSDLVGTIHFSHPLLPDYIKVVLYCPADEQTSYYIDDAGLTECPTDVHTHY